MYPTVVTHLLNMQPNCSDMPPKRVSKPLEVSKVSVVMPPLPPFHVEQPTLWFAQVDAAFACHRIINQVQMYHHVLCSLSQAVLDRILDIIDAATPPSVYTRS